MCKTCVILVYRGVNSNVISWNRVILLHGKSNLLIAVLLWFVFWDWIYELTHTTWCATNAGCRLADWQVIEVNIIVKSSNRFPIPKLDF